MKFNENLSAVQNNFYDIDFTDSIIETMSFNNNLTDFELIVDYYFTEKGEEQITINFENCTTISYDMPKEIYEINDYQLNFSQFTISKVEVEGIDSQICIKLFTVSDENELLKIICQNVIFE